MRTLEHPRRRRHRHVLVVGRDKRAADAGRSLCRLQGQGRGQRLAPASRATGLGVGGTIALGTAQVQPSTWSATSFTFVVPDGTTGTQPLTVNCGKTSNTVGLAILQVPSNAFTISKVAVNGKSATVTVSVPGPGRIEVSGGNAGSASKTVTKASSASLTVSLTKAGKKALAKAKSKKLGVSLRVTFTPAGGTAASKTQGATFKRAAKR